MEFLDQLRNQLQGWLEGPLGVEILNNSLLVWATSLGAFLGIWLALVVTRRIVRSRLDRLAERTQNLAVRLISHAVGKTTGWFLFLVALCLALQVLEWPARIETWLARIIALALFLQLGLWANAALYRFLEVRRERRLVDDPGAVAAMDVLGFVMRVGVWTVVLLLMLDNLGFNITALVAGLGVGGIAIALAAQNVLSDLFASLSIVLDKPFAVGDFLIIGEFLGTVEKVGIKTTRLRSLSGEQLVFSNNDLLGSRIRNYGRMFERRIVFSIGVTYQTPLETLRRIPVIIREAIEAQDKVRFDRSHFQKYGDFALIFESVYYVLDPDYAVYMDIQQAINLRIFEQFRHEGIEFAYPTQTLYVEGLRHEQSPAAPQ